MSSGISVLQSLRVPAALACVALLTASAAPHAANPCAFVPIDVSTYGHDTLRNPPELHASHGTLDMTLATRYTDPRRVKIAGCGVTLRTYDGQLVGPTIRLAPGDTLNLAFANRLPRETAAQVDSQFRQEASSAFITMRPNSFNTTNVHYHGLHVSPVGHSDNVLLALKPGDTFQYQVAIPRDQPPGTYWYHAHAHGSTAIQVGSGMAGALIIDDDPTKIPASLRAANAHEKVMMFATILYDTSGRADDITAFFPDSPSSDTACMRGKTSCTWEHSHRRTTINGQLVPVITMRPGEVQRWRMIDGGFRESLTLRLEGHALHEIALDGIYLGRIDTWSPNQTVDLEPGYRSDVLVQASMKPGHYRLIDDTVPASRGLLGVAERANVLAEVDVEGTPVQMTLPTNAEMARLAYLPGDTLAKHADGIQEAVFKLGSANDPSDHRVYFQVNYAAYNESRVRYVQLGAVDRWSLTTVGDPTPPNVIPSVPHVFHIHVNPFQVQRADPSGKPEWVWKDTQLVPAPPPGAIDTVNVGGQIKYLPRSSDTVNIYTKYTDFTGAFVMHCHILDHEDLGMMEVVDVVKRLPMPMRATPGMPGAKPRSPAGNRE